MESIDEDVLLAVVDAIRDATHEELAALNKKLQQELVEVKALLAKQLNEATVNQIVGQTLTKSLDRAVMGVDEHHKSERARDKEELEKAFAKQAQTMQSMFDYRVKQMDQANQDRLQEMEQRYEKQLERHIASIQEAVKSVQVVNNVAVDSPITIGEKAFAINPVFKPQINIPQQKALEVNLPKEFVKVLPAAAQQKSIVTKRIEYGQDGRPSKIVEETE